MATKKKSASKNKKSPTKNNSAFHSPYVQLCIGVGLIALAIYMTIIIFKGASVHSSQISSELGLIGAFLYNGIRVSVGPVSYTHLTLPTIRLV